MKMRGQGQGWRDSFWSWPEFERDQPKEKWAGMYLPIAVATLEERQRLLNLHTCREAEVILMLAIKKCRQILDLSRPNVKMLARMNVNPAAKCHRERGIVPGTR